MCMYIGCKSQSLRPYTALGWGPERFKLFIFYAFYLNFSIFSNTEMFNFEAIIVCSSG